MAGAGDDRCQPRNASDSDSPDLPRREAESWRRRAEAGETFTRSGRLYKASVVRLVAADCRNYLNGAFGSARLSELTRRDVQSLVDRLRAERDEKGQPKHSHSKVRSVVTSLKIVLRRALEDDEIQVDPTTRLRTRRRPSRGSGRGRQTGSGSSRRVPE